MPPETFDTEFRIRYRMPRPIARAYESVGFAVAASEQEARGRWCAQVALRFVAALRQAAVLVARGGPVNPPAIHDLDSDWPAEVLQGGPAIRPYALEPLAESEREGAHRGLRDALSGIAALADYRLVVAGPAELTVLLGPRMEYRIALRSGEAVPGEVPRGVPLFVDPRSGAFLSLAPLLLYEKPPDLPFGRLLLLRRVDQELGHYVEDGVPGCPGGSRHLAGRPRTGRLSLRSEQLDLLASPPGRFHDGACLENEYLVEGLIWRGGTSDVYAARRLSDDRPFALKTFEYEPGVLDENFWRFIGEERLAQSIRHPRVVVATRTPVGPWGIVHAQELAGRGSLRDQLEINGVLPARLAVAITLQLLDALAAVHAAGIAHNDVKPDNILFDEDGDLRLIDFGIAAPLHLSLRSLRPGAPAGSRGYMAPELLRGGAPTMRSDLFAVGVVLAQMLTGATPADAGDLRRVPGLPAVLQVVLEAWLDPLPGARPRSAPEAAAGLAAAVVGLQETCAVTLDIEGTLVPNYRDRRPRRGLRVFTDFCLSRCERVFVYTLLSEEESHDVFRDLSATGAVAPAWLDRYEYIKWPRGADGSLKDLRRCRVPLSQNVLVDDMRLWVPEDQAHRWVPVANCAEVLGVDRGLERAEQAICSLLGLGGDPGDDAPREPRQGA